MSLINKMLQDLDARGSQGGDPLREVIKPVARNEKSVSLPLAAAVVAAVTALAVAGVFGWRYYRQMPPKPAMIVAAPPALVADPVAVPVPVPTPAPAVTPAPAPPAKVEEAVPPVAAVKPRPKVEAPREVPARAQVQRLAPVPEKPVALTREAASEAGMPIAQRAESEYRRALAALQEGRVSDAMTRLKQALLLDARDEAARQTLVGLLIEDKRQDEAMAQLQTGLTLDPRQPSLAMLLARLQMERGGSAVETLMRSLPAGAGNGEYHALLAGALQRDTRHAEASEQYRAALRTAPDNALWLTGLGISLQADKHDAEALAVFERARASGSLNPQLQGFVERRLAQLRP